MSFITRKTAAHELGTSEENLRKKFTRTGFVPVMRIHQVPFYMRYDFDAWKAEYWNPAVACTGWEECTA